MQVGRREENQMETRRAAVNHLHADGQLAEFQLSFLARVAVESYISRAAKV